MILYRNKHRVFIAALMTACLLLSGCGAAAQETAATAEPEAEEPQTVWQAEKYITLSTYTDGRFNVFCTDTDSGCFYCLRSDKTGEEIPEGETDPVGIYQDRLYRLDEAGKETLLKDFQPLSPDDSDDTAAFNIQAFCQDPEGGLMVLEEEYSEWNDAPAGIPKYTPQWYEYYHQSEQYFVRTLNKTGGEKKKISLEDPTGTGYIYIRDMACAADGTILAAVDDVGVCGYDAEGRLKYTIPLPDGMQSVSEFDELSDGRIAVLLTGRDGRSLGLLDTENQGWSESFTLPEGADCIENGGSLGDFLFVCGDGLYACSFGSQPEYLFSWISCNIDSNFVNAYFVKEDGSITCLADEWVGMYRGSIMGITELACTEPDAEAQILTIGTVNLNRAEKERIIVFNRENENYTIHVEDYSSYNTEENPNAGEEALLQALAEGNGPDILDLNSLNYDTLKSGGWLCDLSSYIREDAELGGEIPDSLVTTLSAAGELYRSYSGFTIVTQAQPDTAAAEAGEYVPTELKSGSWQPFAVSITSPLQIARDDALSGGRAVYALSDENLILPGENDSFTAPDGVYLLFDLSDTYGISSASEHADAAWRFVRTFFTADYEREKTTALPLNSLVLSEQLEDAMTPNIRISDDGETPVPDEEGNPVVDPVGTVELPDGSEGSYYALDERQAEVLQELIDGITAIRFSEA